MKETTVLANLWLLVIDAQYCKVVLHISPNVYCKDRDVTKDNLLQME